MAGAFTAAQQQDPSMQGLPDAVLQPEQMPNYGADPSMGGGYMPYGYGVPPMGGDQAPADYARRMYDTSEELAGGPPGSDNSPLAQLNRMKAERDAAAKERIASIRRAMAILSAAGRGNGVDLPLLAMSAAGSSGTMASGSAALDAYGAAERQQQGIDYSHAIDQSRLEQAAGNVPWEQAQTDETAFDRQQRLAEQYAQNAGRTDAAQMMAKTRQEAAIYSAWARIQAAKQAADARRYAADASARVRSLTGNENFRKLVESQEKILAAAHPDWTGDQLQASAQYEVGRMAQTDPEGIAQQDWDRFAAMNPDGTVYNKDGSVADKDKWVSDRAHAYALATDPGIDQAAQQAAPSPQQPAQPGAAPQKRDLGHAVKGMTGQEVAASLANARAAIAKGADRNAVSKRLQAAGINPAWL